MKVFLLCSVGVVDDYYVWGAKRFTGSCMPQLRNESLVRFSCLCQGWETSVYAQRQIRPTSEEYKRAVRIKCIPRHFLLEHSIFISIDPLYFRWAGDNLVCLVNYCIASSDKSEYNMYSMYSPKSLYMGLIIHQTIVYLLATVNLPKRFIFVDTFHEPVLCSYLPFVDAWSKALSKAVMKQQVANPLWQHLLKIQFLHCGKPKTWVNELPSLQDFRESR